MNNQSFALGLVAALLCPVAGHAYARSAGAQFKKVFVVIFENEDAEKVESCPFFHSLMERGAYLSNFHAEAHPSQPNYIALVSGDTQGVTGDSNVDLDA